MEIRVVEVTEGTERRNRVTEKEENRAHFLLDCLENNGQISLNKEDMLVILKLNREITIDEMYTKTKGMIDIVCKGDTRPHFAWDILTRNNACVR